MVSKKTLLWLMMTGLLLAGCTLIPQYDRPVAPVPETWPAGAAYGEAGGIGPEAVAIAELPWRQFFTDARLQTVIKTALENNRDLRTAALNVERSRAMYRIARSELLPRVNASGSGYRQRTPADLSRSGEAMIAEEYRAELGIASWEPDFFGRIRSLKKRALEEYFATEEARRAARVILISETAAAWLTLAADRENLALARSTLDSQQAAHDLIQRRYDVGLANELDLRRSQTLVEAARVDLARSVEQVARDENALTFLAGTTSLPQDTLPRSLSDMPPLTPILAGTSSAVLLNRPDIRRAENALQAAYANIGAARAMLFPRIALTTAYGSASADLSGLFESGSRAWTFAPGINLPIFDPRAWSALKVSQVDRDIALTQYERTIQSAFREVADALARRGTVGEQVAAQQSLVKATEETFRLSNKRYETGTDDYLSVLDAQRSLYAARQGLISLRLADLVNQVRLYAVLGGGGELDDQRGDDASTTPSE